MTEPQAPIAKEGEVVGQYRLDKLLGKGAAGVVFRGVPLSGGTPVAVKMMPPPTDAMGETIRITLRAATILSSIRHPNVCTVYESGYLNDGRSYVAMEMLDGVALKDVLKHEKAVSDTRAVAIVKQILAGLGEVHKVGIVHRDIKPANIYLVKGKQGEEIAKILDFGIAFIKGGSGDEGQRKGAIYGTATYVSPEQIRALEPDGRADLYSVGVLLYRMVTGQVPFAADVVAEVYKAHLAKAPQKPRDIAPHVSPFIEAAILKAMNKKPEARFQSAEEFSKALDASLRAEETHAATAQEQKPKAAPVPMNSGASAEAPARSGGGSLIAAGLVSGLIGGVIFAALTAGSPTENPNANSDGPKKVKIKVSADAPDAEVSRRGLSLGKLPTEISAQVGEWLVVKAPDKKEVAFEVSAEGTKSFTMQPAEAPPEPESEPASEPTTDAASQPAP